MAFITVGVVVSGSMVLVPTTTEVRVRPASSLVLSGSGRLYFPALFRLSNGQRTFNGLEASQIASEALVNAALQNPIMRGGAVGGGSYQRGRLCQQALDTLVVHFLCFKALSLK